MTKIPDLRNIFSYTLSDQDIRETDEFLIKDLSALLRSRDFNDVIIVDIDSSRVDEDLFSSIIL